MKQYDIHVESIKDQIYRILKQEIIDCTLKSGEKLVEQTIAARFNVSRAPVREAIKQLTGDGLVINITNRGAFVKVPTAKEMEDICNYIGILAKGKMVFEGDLLELLPTSLEELFIEKLGGEPREQ